MSKHTEGPWKVSVGGSMYGGSAYIIGPEGKNIALVLDGFGITKEEALVNANLLASASEMLEFCRLISNALDSGLLIINEVDHFEGAQVFYDKLDHADNWLDKLLAFNVNETENP